MKVECTDCGWTGDESDLLPDKDGFKETTCPQCRKDDCLMDCEACTDRPFKNCKCHEHYAESIAEYIP